MKGFSVRSILTLSLLLILPGRLSFAGSLVDFSTENLSTSASETPRSLSASAKAKASSSVSAQSSDASTRVPTTRVRQTELDLATRVFYRGMNTTNRGAETSGPVDRLESAGLILLGSFKHRLHPSLMTRLRVGAKMETGSSQALLTNTEPANLVFVDHAEAEWRPISRLGLSVGALNQEFLQAPLLANDEAFPAARQSLYLGPAGRLPRWQLQLTAQQAIPTSRTLGTQNEQDEPFAKFYTQTGLFNVRIARYSNFKLRATHFVWNDLTSAAAGVSRLRGNSVTPDPAPAAKFRYDYHGYEGGGEITLRLGSTFEVSGGGSYLINEGAPEGQNKGRSLFAQTRGLMTRQMEITLKGEHFINQADSSPGMYNAGGMILNYGHNNRQGYLGQIKLRFPKHDFSVSSTFVDSHLIDSNPFQQNNQSLFISLEALYDIL